MHFAILFWFILEQISIFHQIKIPFADAQNAKTPKTRTLFGRYQIVCVHIQSQFKHAYLFTNFVDVQRLSVFEFCLLCRAGKSQNKFYFNFSCMLVYLILYNFYFINNSLTLLLLFKVGYYNNRIILYYYNRIKLLFFYLGIITTTTGRYPDLLN
jgi:hypothetical protein